MFMAQNALSEAAKRADNPSRKLSFPVVFAKDVDLCREECLFFSALKLNSCGQISRTQIPWKTLRT